MVSVNTMFLMIIQSGHDNTIHRIRPEVYSHTRSPCAMRAANKSQNEAYRRYGRTKIESLKPRLTISKKGNRVKIKGNKSKHCDMKIKFEDILWLIFSEPNNSKICKAAIVVCVALIAVLVIRNIAFP